MRKNLAILASLLSALPAVAQTASTPVAGTVVDVNGNLLAVSGVLETLLPGVPVAVGNEAVRSAAFGSAGGGIKTDSQALVVDAAGSIQSRRPAPAGSALWAFGRDGSLQWLYIAGATQIESLSGAASIGVNSLGGELIALGIADTGALPVLSRTGSQLWAEMVDPVTGAITGQMPVPGSAPAVAFEGGWLVTGGKGLFWIGPNGEAPLEIPSPAAIRSLQTAGAHSVAVNGHWLLNGHRLLNGAGKLLEIPAAIKVRPRSVISPPGRNLQ